MNISITGNLGAGKSSICKILKAHGYEIISAGTIFRQLAQERGLSEWGPRHFTKFGENFRVAGTAWIVVEFSHG